MRKKLTLLLTFLFIVVCLSFFYLGASNNIIKKAPVNPDFLKYMENFQKGISGIISDDGHYLGRIPPPVDLSHAKGIADDRVRKAYSDSYDLRDYNKLNPVRDQAGCGACWAFGTMASLESCLFPSQTPDFSEQDLNATHGFDFPECEGGHSFMSQAYLGRWSGPLNESDVPYPYTSGSTYSPSKHVQQVIWLPERSSYTDNDTIKDFVTTYGAIYCAFYWDDSNYNSSNYSYYYSGGEAANHTVAIVGWDDNYDRNNFNSVPSSDGAFILRNQWGTSFGESGYFYMSYYDNSLEEIVAFNNAEPADNYEHVYQYDPLGWVSNWGAGTVTCWGANIFTAANNLPLRAVGLITNDLNTQYTIYIYTGVTAGNPTSGTLAATKSGSQTYPGYYTVELDSPASLSQGANFAVVIQFVNSSYGWPITTEGKYSGYSSGASSNQGESFISPGGSTWTDFYDIDPSEQNNATIKAFCGGTTVTPKDDLLGTWSGQGVYCRNSDTGAWVYMATPASKITCGDLDGDGIDDLIGVWPVQGGVWAKYSSISMWTSIASSADWIGAGDMNGDGRVDLLGTWSGEGVYYMDVMNMAWVQVATPATQITAGDIDDDGTDDLIGIWPAQGGVWIKYSSSGAWSNLSSTADWISTGDMNGDGRCDLLGTWTGQGVYYRNSDTGSWVKMASSASQITCGDLDGDSTDDLIGIWPAQGGVWVKYSSSGAWSMLSSTADWIAAGKMRAAGGGSSLVGLIMPAGGIAEGPSLFGDYEDLLSSGPGGLRFKYTTQENIEVGIKIDREMQNKVKPGPGEAGFEAKEERRQRPRKK